MAGFSVVDVGGNWLRVFRAGDTEEDAGTADAGLSRIVEVAARLGDSHGDDAAALKAPESGLRRFSDAPRLDRVRALLYRAELEIRLGHHQLAKATLAEMRGIELDKQERTLVEDEIQHVTRLVDGN